MVRTEKFEDDGGTRDQLESSRLRDASGGASQYGVKDERDFPEKDQS